MAVKVLSRELLMVERPNWGFQEGVKLSDHVRAITMPDGKVVHEFIGSDQFGAVWNERQRYEVDRGRDLEPLLYQPLYSITEDRSLPRNVSINRLGPAGVVFEKIEEGGEVKFATIGNSNFSVPIYHYAFGLEYSDDLVEYNELWSVAEVENQSGTAYNALFNHIHLHPFIAASYGSNNQTDGGALDYTDAETLPERYLRTLEAAITHATNDTTNPRRGPYALLTGTTNLFTLERAITVVPQLGITLQSSAMNLVTAIIAYNGWTGSRGEIQTTYAGVDAGKAYLVDLGTKARNQRSYVKHGLRRSQGNPDVSRFILEQSVWDTRFGTYTDVAASTEEITLPTMSD